MFTVKEALKSVNSYFQVQNFIIENAFLFGDTSFKVILNLLSRVDYSLRNTITVMSYPELQSRTGKQRSSLQAAISELEKKGFIRKISGKYDPEFARFHRALLYQQPQKVIRSYNEVNAYDLAGLFILVALYQKLLQYYEKHLVVDFLYQLKKHYEITQKPIIDAVLGAFYTSPDIPIGIYLIGKSGGEIYQIGKSDLPNYVNLIYQIGKSDLPIGKEPYPYSRKQETHTHTTPHDGNDFEEEGLNSNSKVEVETPPIEPEPDKKAVDIPDMQKVATRKGKGKNKNSYNPPEDTKPPQQSLDTQGQKQEKNFSPPEPKSSIKIDDELKRYIQEDLLEQEKAGKINSAQAIWKSLTDEDIEIYRKKYEEYLKEKAEQERKEKIRDFALVVFSLSDMKNEERMAAVFGKDWQERFQEKIEKGELRRNYVYAYLMTTKDAAQKLEARAKKHGFTFEVRNYAEEEQGFLSLPEWNKWK